MTFQPKLPNHPESPTFQLIKELTAIMRIGDWRDPRLQQVVPDSEATLVLVSAKQEWTPVHLDWAGAKNCAIGIDLVSSYRHELQRGCGSKSCEII